MTLIDDARTAIFALADLARGNPDPVSVIKIQADLVRLHLLVGEELTKTFSGKERAYIARQIAQAKAYQHGRYELKLTGADSTEAALLASGEDLNREADSAAEYEGYRTLFKSLQNSIDFAQSVVSLYKNSESNA